jgi:phosphate transport system ATP-binding protein
MKRRSELDAIVEQCLRQAALWDEVKDRLDNLGTKLSGGQQQRLTIARALSHQPEILCLDEFSIAIDPVTTMRIEDVLKELRRDDHHHVTNLCNRPAAWPTTCSWNGQWWVDRTSVIFFDNPEPRTYGVNGFSDEHQAPRIDYSLNQGPWTLSSRR